MITKVIALVSSVFLNLFFLEFDMKKFSFTVDLVSEYGDVDAATARGLILDAVDGLSDHRAVTFNGETEMTEHGMKVWSKRVAGISLAVPKPAKAPKAPKVEAEAEATA